MVIADNESDEMFAVMSLSEYENLAQLRKMDWTPEKTPECISRQVGDLSEQEMLEKINRDIDDWRGAQKKTDEDLTVESVVGDSIEIAGSEEETEVKISKIPTLMPRVADVLNNEAYRERKFDDKPRVNWVEEENLSDVPHEEEKFYLEPVE